MNESRGVISVGSGSGWDDRRNSSQVRQPDPMALENCLDAMAALRRNDPALCQWIADGYPTLTEAEHLARFGEPYRRKGKVKT